MMKKLSLLVAIMLLVGMALAGCKGNEATPGINTEAKASDRMVNWLDSQEPPEMNTMLMTDVVSLNLHKHVTEGLVRLGPKNERMYGMAEKWDVSEDGLTYTFHIRDAKWSNGDKVTAKDFEFAWMKLLDPATGAYYSYMLAALVKGAAEYNAGTGKAEDVAIEAKDDKTFVVTLVNPVDYFLDICAFGVTSPINQKFYETVGAENFGKDADKMLYNGPFVMESWEHEVGLVLKKNKDYYKANEVKIGGVDIRIVKDSETALNMFLAGDLDMVGVRGSQIETVEAEGFTVQQYGDGATFYLEFNTRPEYNGAVNPFSNKYIRQAFSYALDRQGYIDTVLKNASLPATSYTTPEIAGKDKATFPQEFAEPLVKDNDGAAAAEALQKGLDELGLKKEDLKISMLSDDTDVAKETAAFYKECWTRNLGVDVEILTMPFKSRIEKLQSDDFLMSSSGWGPDFNDPMTFLDLFETGNGNNHTGYSSAEYDGLLAQARKEGDRAKRYDIYFQLEKLLLADMPIAPIYFRNRDFTTVPELKGVVRNALQDCTLIWAYFDEKK